MRDVDDNAAWRSQPLSHDDLIMRIIENGQSVSPLLQVAWVNNRIFRKDWLHCCDQGVAADTLGNMFKMFMDKFAGTKAQKLHTLWEAIQQYYRENPNVEAKLQTLTATMIQPKSKGPKLKCSAAECRALVPFASNKAREILSTADATEHAAILAIESLHECYKALSHESIFYRDVLRTEATKFAINYTALDDAFADPKVWKTKPKMHIFVELCSEGSRPSTFWTYRDEDFGGSVARASRRKGGMLSVPSYSSAMLTRFRIRNPMIRMVAS